MDYLALVLSFKISQTHIFSGFPTNLRGCFFYKIRIVLPNALYRLVSESPPKYGLGSSAVTALLLQSLPGGPGPTCHWHAITAEDPHPASTPPHREALFAATLLDRLPKSKALSLRQSSVCMLHGHGFPPLPPSLSSLQDASFPGSPFLFLPCLCCLQAPSP